MARRALSPAQLAVVQAVRAVLTDGPIQVRTACSGGADSLALAAGLAWCQRHDPDPSRTVSALVVDHGLQPDSAAVATRTVAALATLGLDAASVRVRVDAASPDGLEAAARMARYAALAGPGADLVLLGHTLDDQAETVLLGLARGSGARSLAGMPASFAWEGPHDGARLAAKWDKLEARSPQSPDFGVFDHTGHEFVPNGPAIPGAAPVGGAPLGKGPVFIRPLLGLRRTITARACADWGLDPWEDPMNADPRFARTRARRALAMLDDALGPGVAEALARTAALCADDADLLDALADDELTALPHAAGLPAAGLAALPAALQGRVARRWLAEEGLAAPDFDRTRAVLALATAWHGQRGVDLPGGVVVRSGDVLVARRRPAEG